MNTGIVIAVVVLITVAVVFGLSRKTKTNPPQNAPANRPSTEQMKEFFTSERTKNFFQRPSSFSLVLFKGDVANDLPKLLENCRYKVLKSSAVKTNFPDLYANLPAPNGPKNALVSKAFCRLSGYTVLCEPEMVLFTNSKELARFCSEHSTEIIAAIWERVSETVSLTQISAAGVTRQTFYIAGKPEGEQKQPHKPIQDDPTNKGLLRALAELGVPLSELNGEVEATILSLQE
jgi:hypothetical protein